MVVWFDLVSFCFVFLGPPLDGKAQSVATKEDTYEAGGHIGCHGSPTLLSLRIKAIKSLPSVLPPPDTPDTSDTACPFAAGPAFRSLRPPDVSTTNRHVLEDSLAVASVRGRFMARACQGPRLGQRAGGTCTRWPSVECECYGAVWHPSPSSLFSFYLFLLWLFPLCLGLS